MTLHEPAPLGDRLTPPPSPSVSADIGGYFTQLQEKCSEIVKLSCTDANKPALAKSHHFSAELASWCVALGSRRETELLWMARLEHELAVLALAQGHYRHAFKGLRLVLELTLQAVYLSANELRLREWLDNRRDTTWNAIVNPTTNDDAVFGPRFAEAFFPELKPHVAHFLTLAGKVYRECSECVHGNVPKLVPLPSVLSFDQTTFDLWHSKAQTVALVAHFALSLRFLPGFDTSQLSKVEIILNDHLAYLSEVRAKTGGPLGP